MRVIKVFVFRTQKPVKALKAKIITLKDIGAKLKSFLVTDMSMEVGQITSDQRRDGPTDGQEGS